MGHVTPSDVTVSCWQLIWNLISQKGIHRLGINFPPFQRVLFLSGCAAHSLSLRCQGPDQAHQDGADGHRADEGPRERPGDAGRPPVQLGQVLHQHPGAPEDLAGQHGSHPQQEQRPFRGTFSHRTSREAVKTTNNLVFPVFIFSVCRRPCVTYMLLPWWQSTCGGKVSLGSAWLIIPLNYIVMLLWCSFTRGCKMNH